jgi:citrate lyase beta subunit
MTTPARTSLDDATLRRALAPLETANAGYARRFPGESPARQPVHTVYGGAHLFRGETGQRLGVTAVKSLDDYGPDAFSFARACGLPGADRLPDTLSARGAVLGRLEADPAVVRAVYPEAWFAHTIYTRVRRKLQREAVEDFRIDFEDGYGNRPDTEEDGHARSAAEQTAKGLAAGTLPPFVGIRIKPFTTELMRRGVRTLDIFLTALVEASGGRMPPGFVVTLPKITLAEQVTLLADLFDLLEPKLGLPTGALKMEFMVETPQSLVGPGGVCNLTPMLDAARGRCIAAHFGTYDYTASCNITAAHQHMTHPACDFARHIMQIAYAGTGLWLSDGATNIMPVPVHRAGADGPPLTPEQVQENRASVHRAWRLHVEHITHSLVRGYYQGWDLHPAQLPTRYAALYSFFLAGLDAATERLSNFIAKAGQATLVGDVFDDAATGQGLLNYFLRAMNCGAITEEEALATGLTLEELRSRSFVKILEGRRKRAG